jgi:CAAX protease family protein
MNAHTEKKFPWAFVALAIGFSWLVLLPGVLATYRVIAFPVPTLALIAIAQFGSSLAGIVLTWREQGRPGVARLFKRALDWHIPWRWLLAILLLPLGLAGSALGLHVLTGGVPPALSLLVQPIAIPFVFLFIFFLQGPVPEEFGWRGYFLDRLQVRWNALAASLVLGVIWGLYHLPVFFMQGAALANLPLWAWFIQVIAVAVLFTWLYNNTGGNLLAALLFHAMVNTSIQVFPPMDIQSGGDPRGFTILTALYVLAATIVVATWGAQTLRRGAPEVAVTGRLVEPSH